MRRAVIVYAPRPATARWIHEELVGEPYKVVVVPSFAALVSRLAERVDQIAIVDFDATTEDDVASLLSIRDSSWTGELIALGRIDIELRMMLRVREMFMRPLGSERLRTALQKLAFDASTIPVSGLEQTTEVPPFR
jgi:hypothetical protein